MDADEILVIVIISLVFICFVYTFAKYDLKPIMRLEYIKWVKRIGIIIVGLILAYLFLNLDNIQPNSWVLIALYAGLVGITLVYAVGSHRQADASYKMSKEMREQRFSESQPYLLIRLEDRIIRWHHVEPNDRVPNRFEVKIKNEGKGPAINLWTGLWNPTNNFIGENKGYLASGEEWQATIHKQSLPPISIDVRFVELTRIIRNYSPEPIVVKYEDINKRSWISYISLIWHAAYEGCVVEGEQNIVELKND